MRTTREIRSNGLGDTRYRSAYGIAEERATNVVRKGGCPVGGNANKVCPGPIREIRRDTITRVVFIEVKVHALHEIGTSVRVDQIAQISVVLHVTAQGIGTAHRGSGLIDGDTIHARRPERNRGAASSGKIIGAVLAVAELKATDHSAHWAGGI